MCDEENGAYGEEYDDQTLLAVVAPAAAAANSARSAGSRGGGGGRDGRGAACRPAGSPNASEED